MDRPDAEPPPLRVLVADDEPMLRAGVRAVLASDPRIEIVAEVADGHDAVRAADRTRPDVAVLDVRMPGLDGLVAAERIGRLAPDIKIIILTTYGDDDNIRRALTGGAVGFLLKASDPRELLRAVHAVADGAAYLSPRVADRVLADYRATPPPGKQGGTATDRVAQLTSREREVLSLLTDGLSNAEIGRRLFMVEGTVKGHVSSILMKLGAANRVQAAVLGYQAGLTG